MSKYKMPKTKRTRKYGNKKRRAYRSKRKTTVSALKSVGPLPPRYLTTHKYSQPMTLSLSNGYQYKFNLNSLFDPDRTGIGHQPYGYDQLAALYNRYRVISCSYTISGIQSDIPGTNVRIAAQPANDEINYGTVSAMCEAPRSKFIIQGAAGAPLKTLHGRCYIPSLVGRNKIEYMSDDRYQAAVGQSPQEFAILNIMAGSMSDGGVTVNCVITLEYKVEWFDIQQLGQS